MSERPQELERIDAIRGGVTFAHETIFAYWRRLTAGGLDDLSQSALLAESAQIVTVALPKLTAPLLQAERAVTKLDLTSAKRSLAAPGWHCRNESVEDFLELAPSGSTYTFLQASVPGRPGGFTAFAGVGAEHPEPSPAEITGANQTHSRRGDNRPTSPSPSLSTRSPSTPPSTPRR
jgi:hypothetical protein